MTVAKLTTDRMDTRTSTAFLKGNEIHNTAISGSLWRGPSDDPMYKVPGGTIMGRIGAAGLTKNMLRPVGHSIVTESTTPSVTQTLPTPVPFRKGDQVTFYQADGSTVITADVEILSVNQSTGVITLDEAVTTVTDSVVKNDDGSDVAVGISWQDVNSFYTVNERGVPVHIDKGMLLLRYAWVEWALVRGTNSFMLAEIKAIGIRVEV